MRQKRRFLDYGNLFAAYSIARHSDCPSEANVVACKKFFQLIRGNMIS